MLPADIIIWRCDGHRLCRGCIVLCCWESPHAAGWELFGQRAVLQRHARLCCPGSPCPTSPNPHPLTCSATSMRWVDVKMRELGVRRPGFGGGGWGSGGAQRPSGQSQQCGAHVQVPRHCGACPPPCRLQVSTHPDYKVTAFMDHTAMLTVQHPKYGEQSAGPVVCACLVCRYRSLRRVHPHAAVEQRKEGWSGLLVCGKARA